MAEDAIIQREEVIEIWIHQSKLHWSRLQTLTVLNLAIFGAWYATRESLICILVLVVGVVFNFFIRQAMLRDREFMFACQKELNFLDARPVFNAMKGNEIAKWISNSLFFLQILLIAFSVAALFYCEGERVAMPKAKEQELELELKIGEEELQILRELLNRKEDSQESLKH